MSFWIAGAVIVAGVAATASSVHSSNDQRKSIANAGADAQARNDKALKEAQLAQDTAASQAKAQIDQKRRAMRAGSQTIFTNPTAVASQSALAKKTLLGG